MALRSRKAIISALTYAHIFHGALTKNELWRYLLFDETDQLRGTKKEFEKEFVFLKQKKIIVSSSYIALSPHAIDILRRKETQKESLRKIKRATHIASLLTYIPSISMISISGSVAAMNALPQDDIDLFIITAPHTLWVTRLIIHILLLLSGQRRNRTGTHVRDKICVNMLLDRQTLLLPKSRQNVYTAHEIAQMIPLFSRERLYEKFIEANKWYMRFLPNANQLPVTHIGIESAFFIYLLKPLEPLARSFQLWYMRNHRTTEYITDTYLAFHPKDHTEYVLSSFKLESAKYPGTL